MLVVMFIFALSGAIIAGAVVYAAINLVRSDIELKRSEKRHLERKNLTLIDISSTIKKIENADNNTTNKLLKELREIRQWIEKYY